MSSGELFLQFSDDQAHAIIDYVSEAWLKDNIKKREEPEIDKDRRVLEDGAFYPVIANGIKWVLQYGDTSKAFHPAMDDLIELNECDWIGEKLEIKWPI